MTSLIGILYNNQTPENVTDFDSPTNTKNMTNRSKRGFAFVILLIVITACFAQKKEDKSEIREIQKDIQIIKTENKILEDNYNNLSIQYQHTNDSLNNYLTYTTIISSIFGILIALAGIYIGFESLRSQSRTRDAIRTLEEAKAYVINKKTDFDNLIETKKQLLQTEYENIILLLKGKLLSDIEIETSKVKEIAGIKVEEIQKISVEQQNSKTIELLEKRLEFFENVGIPDDPLILFSKGKILQEKKMHREAILLFEKLIDKVPDHKQGFWYLGYEYAEINETEKSIKNYKKHLELNPNDSSALNNIALRYQVKGNLLDGLECLNKAIELSNKKELYYKNRIAILEKLNSNDRVIENYVQLISINPEEEEYYREIIELLKKEKRDIEVTTYFEKAINHFKEKNKDTSNYFNFSKASYLGNIGKEQDAIEILQNLIDNNFRIDHCYIEIADLKNKLGLSSEAKSILDNGISKNPLSSILYIYKAFIESSSSESVAKSTIDKGGQVINNEKYYQYAGRFFNQKNSLALSNYCYEGALRIVNSKLTKEEINEGDVMNYYEISIILQRSLADFNQKYRKLVVSEKYLIILKVLDILNELVTLYNVDERRNAISQIKKLNIEAKDKDLIQWDFNDIDMFISKKKGGELSIFTKQLIRYLQRQIKIEEI